MPRQRLLSDVLDDSDDDPRLVAARDAVHESRWVRLLEQAQLPDGTWCRYCSTACRGVPCGPTVPRNTTTPMRGGYGCATSQRQRCQRSRRGNRYAQPPAAMSEFASTKCFRGPGILTSYRLSRTPLSSLSIASWSATTTASTASDTSIGSVRRGCSYPRLGTRTRASRLTDGPKGMSEGLSVSLFRLDSACSGWRSRF